MNDLEVSLHIEGLELSPSNPFNFRNILGIVVDTKSDEYQQNQTTGQRIRTGQSTQLSPPLMIEFDLHSSNHLYIGSLLHNQLINFPQQYIMSLAVEISTAANNLGFGFNGFVLTVFVTVTYKTTVFVRSDPPSNHEGLLKAVQLKTVLLGCMSFVEDLKMETESCSICLENLSCSKLKPTRMACSHVFHDHCLLEWFKRNNNCPLCRTVLYDR